MPDLKKFVNYCWGFYGPKGIYGDFFSFSLTKKELAAACALRAAGDEFEGDSVDREIVRDILLTSRGIKA